MLLVWFLCISKYKRYSCLRTKISFLLLSETLIELVHFLYFLQKQYTIEAPYLNGRKLPRPSELDRDEAVEVGVEERMHDVLLTSEQPPEPDSLSDCWPPLFVAIKIKMHLFDNKTNKIFMILYR